MRQHEIAIDELAARFPRVRAVTEALAAPLSEEDAAVQSMPDASPAKWHLAHTSWFFEHFVLSHEPGFRPFHERYGYLFNSYYEAAGPRHPRPSRGLLTRPSLGEVRAYREHVTCAVSRLLESGFAGERGLLSTIELGVHHEQQHQELLLTDVKHLFGSNPLLPAYRAGTSRDTASTVPLELSSFDAGVRVIGHGGPGFAFDNETPEHRAFVEAFSLANRLVTNGEYREFIRDGGYARPELWLSDGFRACQERNWSAPLYWILERDAVFTLAGERPLRAADPVCHVSYYEADAFARWAGLRLPTEIEWETAARERPISGNLLESESYEPRALEAPGSGVHQMFGDVWEWTASSYAPYPGYRQPAGALGEYNGKFMCNRLVLRGGSCATPRSHVRPSYRNFFPPDARWQFSGIRLARTP